MRSYHANLGHVDASGLGEAGLPTLADTPRAALGTAAC